MTKLGSCNTSSLNLLGFPIFLFCLCIKINYRYLIKANIGIQKYVKPDNFKILLLSYNVNHKKHKRLKNN